MKISIIVAISSNNVIGIADQLPWHLPADLRFFKSITVNHPILMGRKTFESIGRPLPNRTNIVITRDLSFRSENLIIKHSIDSAIDYCHQNNFDEIFIIGGDTIYSQTLTIADKLYITRVDAIVENGSAFFPLVDQKIWKLISSSYREKDELNINNMTFEVYEKK